MRKRYLSLSALLMIVLISSCRKQMADSIEFPTSVSNPADEFSATDKYVPHELVVRFRNGLDDKSKLSAFAQISGTIKERVVTASMKQRGDNEGFYLIHTPLDVTAAIKLISSADIVFAEPNFVYRYDAISNDTYVSNGSLWGMYGDGSSPANAYGSQAAEAWAKGHTGSDNVCVGVIDEGAMFSHTDLAANFWNNPFDPADGKDNDGNGYIDDVHGWDFVANDGSTFDGTADDHGTHVSGTIGAVGNNGAGVAGINWKVKIITAKFLGKNGGTTVNAVKALEYLIDLKTRHGLDMPATNNSWGGGGFSQALKDAIDHAATANILFVAAAGNESSNNDAVASYPSNYTSSNIIAVASITSTGALSSFSNYGKTTVDIGAPGSSIVSTVPVKSGNKVSSGYASYSGTSMATPHVTGAAALYESTHPGSTAAQIKAAILNAAVPTSSLNGKTATGGRLNVSGF